MALALFLSTPLAALAHPKFNSYDDSGCDVLADAVHGAGADIDVTTRENGTQSNCLELRSKARWKVDGQWFIDVESDWSGILNARAGWSFGFDIFGSFNHDYKKSNGNWVVNFLWH